MDVLPLNITDNKYNYGKFLLTNDNVVEENERRIIRRLRNRQIHRKSTRIGLDGAFVHYLIQELKISKIYRINFIKKWTIALQNKLTLMLKPTKYDLIDYNWNERVFVMVRERCELEHALSWLSTLGGAFSALGDYFPNCAETAGKISIHQLKLALRLGDPSIAARCRLYLSLSLIQKKKFKYARRIITTEYHLAKSTVIVDVRLLNMCRGIWSKLQYDHDVFRKNRTYGLSKKMKNVSI